MDQFKHIPNVSPEESVYAVILVHWVIAYVIICRRIGIQSKLDSLRIAEEQQPAAAKGKMGHSGNICGYCKTNCLSIIFIGHI